MNNKDNTIKRSILFIILISVGFSQTSNLEKYYITTQIIDATMSTYAIQNNMAVEANLLAKKLLVIIYHLMLLKQY